MTPIRYGFLLWLGFVSYFPAHADDGSPAAKVVSEKSPAVFQIELLETAFETASAIPVEPHIKTRSRMQEQVVAACLKLDQPKQARAYSDKIGNWCRGSCYADLAYYYAQHGDVAEAERQLNDAKKVIDEIKEEEWRISVIQVKIAKTYARMRELKQADKYQANLAESDVGKVASVQAEICPDDSFDEQVKSLDALIAPGVFDIVKNALEAYTQLFDRFYSNSTRRALVEEKIRASWGRIPYFIRIDLLLALADSALKHNDSAKALELVNEAQAFLDNGQWPVEKRVARMGEIIKMRFRAGDVNKARADADAMLTLFNAEKSKIVNIYRAEGLRPLAEACQTMGDTKAARAVYKQVLAEGAENPNSKPRAEDLSATCCSMALYAVEPDAELKAQIHQIRGALGNPW